MKYIITIVAALMITAVASSQSLYSFDYTVSFGSGETADYIQSPSFRGITFEGRGFITDQVSLGGLFTWTTFYEELAGATFTYESAALTGTQYRYINAYPLLFQAHYYLGTDDLEPRAYLGGGFGAYKINQRTNMGVWSVEENNWHFGLSPEVGILLPVSFDTYLNVSFRYHYVFKAKETIDHSWFGLSLGLAWGD
ncbi:MAG: hypothetical protein KQI35_18885 [Bacteroidetes bacterium]|nr:hypothetical protein [Bacteroidota bacterium]